MNFSLSDAIPVLKHTPHVLHLLLHDLPDQWVDNNEGDNTWSPYDIVGHLIHGEKTDWIVRTKIILEQKDTPFASFDRFAQFEASKGKDLSQLLDEFRELRKKNLDTLESMNLTKADLEKTGMHPELGEVTLKQLLATWVVHDLGHIRQVARVMAKQYKHEVGPWAQYLSVVHE
ncbi:MAG: DinB family protein [Balneolaceae bacterium]|nr:DinB family protein [Balneolaceae bacterium]